MSEWPVMEHTCFADLCFALREDEEVFGSHFSSPFFLVSGMTKGWF
jgi:hypothetical protein